MNHKTIRPDDNPGLVHDLTFSCYNRYHYLQDPVAYHLLTYEISKAKIKFSFRVWAYVFMIKHFHLLIWTLNESYSIAAMERQKAWIPEINNVNQALKGRIMNNVNCREHMRLNSMGGIHVIDGRLRRPFRAKFGVAIQPGPSTRATIPCAFSASITSQMH